MKALFYRALFGANFLPAALSQLGNPRSPASQTTGFATATRRARLFLRKYQLFSLIFSVTGVFKTKIALHKKNESAIQDGSAVVTESDDDALRF